MNSKIKATMQELQKQIVVDMQAAAVCDDRLKQLQHDLTSQENDKKAFVIAAGEAQTFLNDLVEKYGPIPQDDPQ